MVEKVTDTHPKAAALQRILLRQATPAWKLAMLGQMKFSLS
jgi:hypothetical protein